MRIDIFIERGKALGSICLFAVAFVAANGRAAEPVPPAFLKKLASIAGPDSRDCGVVTLPGDRTSAIACAEAAASSGSAYRVAVQLQASGSLTWQGAARDAHGKLSVVFYDDSDPSAGSPSSVTLSVLACREIVFSARGEDVIDCRPFIGGP